MVGMDTDGVEVFKGSPFLNGDSFLRFRDEGSKVSALLGGMGEVPNTATMKTGILFLLLGTLAEATDRPSTFFRMAVASAKAICEERGERLEDLLNDETKMLIRKMGVSL